MFTLVTKVVIQVITQPVSNCSEILIHMTKMDEIVATTKCDCACH